MSSLSKYLSENHSGRAGRTKYVPGYKVGKLRIISVEGDRIANRKFKCKCDCGGSAVFTYDQIRKRESEAIYPGCKLCKPKNQPRVKREPVRPSFINQWLQMPIVRSSSHV